MNFETIFRHRYALAFSSVATVAAVGLVVVYLFYKWSFSYWRHHNVRSTRPWFPLGDFSQVGFTKNIGVVLKDIYDQFEGERFNGMWCLFRPFLMIRDPDLIRIMFVKDAVHFRDRGINYNEKLDPLSANLFFIGGPRWKGLRAKLTANFSSGKMKTLFREMSDKSRDLRKYLGDSPGETKGTKDYVSRYSHDIASTCLLGFQANSLLSSESALPKIGEKMFASTWTNLIRTGINVFLPDLAHFLRVTSTPSDVADFFLETAKKVVEYRVTQDMATDHGDFVQTLIRLMDQGYDEEIESGRDVNGNIVLKQGGKRNFSVEDAAAQGFIFWVGASEGPAVIMQFALYEMALNDVIQEKARAEVRDILARFGGTFTYESLSEMKYLGRLIDETLRKYPPVPMLNRRCQQRYQIPGTDIVVEKGLPIIVSVLGLHMDPRYYPDPEKFDPERFTEEEKRKRHNYVYLPFGEGLHQCIGQRYARMLMKIGLATLLTEYKFEISPRTPKKLQFCPKRLLYSDKNAIPLKVTKLKD